MLLVDDDLGKLRESDGGALNAGYTAAFNAMERDPNCMLMVAIADGALVGTFQLNFLPSLSHMGAWRGQIEAVRVASHLRGQGIGIRMMERAIEICEKRGSKLVQLTSDKARSAAHRFYERLGFVVSHEGFKLKLN